MFTPWANARSIAAACMAWWRPLGAGQGVRGPHYGQNPRAAYHGSEVATKLKVMGVEIASLGIVEPEDERDEMVQFTEPKKGTYKKLIIRDGRLVEASCWATSVRPPT